MKRLLACATLLLTSQLSGCFIADYFADDPHKPAELTPIKETYAVKPLWNVHINGGERYFFTPAVVRGSVYAAGSDGTVVKVDAATGAQTWRIALDKHLSAGVGADETTVSVAGVDGDVYALDSDGKTRWTMNVGGEILSPPAVGEGIVVVRTTDGRFIALDGTTGQRRWLYSRQAQPLVLRGAPGMVISNGSVFAGLPGGRVVALAVTNGGVRWETSVSIPKGATELERVADVMGTPVVSPRDVCVASFQGRAGCFELARGTPVWTHDVSTPNGIGIEPRTAFVTDERSVVQAFSRLTGSSLWSNDKLLYRRLTTPIPLAGAVAVGDFQGFVHWLDINDGSIVGRQPTDGSPIVTAPLTGRFGGHDGWLVQTQNGGLYVFLAP